MSEGATVTTCPACGQDVVQPPNASPEVSAARPATHYCPVCGRQYPEDGSCDYGHPNVPQLVPIGQEHAIDSATGEGWKSAVDEPAAEADVPPPAEPVYGQQPSQPEADPNAAPAEGADHTPPDAPAAAVCSTCQGNRTVPAPPPAGEVICPTCSGTGEAPASV